MQRTIFETKIALEIDFDTFVNLPLQPSPFLLLSAARRRHTVLENGETVKSSEQGLHEDKVTSL